MVNPPPHTHPLPVTRRFQWCTCDISQDSVVNEVRLPPILVHFRQRPVLCVLVRPPPQLGRDGRGPAGPAPTPPPSACTPAGGKALPCPVAGMSQVFELLGNNYVEDDDAMFR